MLAFQVGTQAGPRGPAPRAQVMTLRCRPATCRQRGRSSGQRAWSGVTPQPAANGIKVPETPLRWSAGFGWTPAKVPMAINGILSRACQRDSSYAICPGRGAPLSGLPSQDHANGQYRLGDRVQVNVEGEWVDSKTHNGDGDRLTGRWRFPETEPQGPLARTYAQPHPPQLPPRPRAGIDELCW